MTFFLAFCFLGGDGVLEEEEEGVDDAGVLGVVAGDATVVAGGGVVLVTSVVTGIEPTRNVTLGELGVLGDDCVEAI